MIIGILGFAQSGKDTVANLLQERGAQKIGFADALKRVTMNIFDFTFDQMWGSIKDKETPDKRYPRPLHEFSIDERTGELLEPKCQCCGVHYWANGEPGTEMNPDMGICYLTPRYALKIVGTEGARHCWADIWVKKGIEFARCIELGAQYEVTCGLGHGAGYGKTAIFIDCRFINEVEGIQKAGGMVYRIKRPGYDKPMFNHASETEQLYIPDDRLQGVIHNDGTLEDLKAKVYQLPMEQ
jgi:hypothetical protein